MTLFGKLSALTSEQLETWVAMARPRTQAGELPTYIPRLATVAPHWLAIQIQTIAGQTYTAGDRSQSFCLMSVVKVFVLLLLLEQWGATQVFEWVGCEPSEQPFNALTQLEADSGWPRNPMINSGAIALASHLPGEDAASRCQHLCQWLNQAAGCHLTLDTAMLASVQATGNPRNAAIADYLAHTGHLATTAAIALQTYNHLCCLQGTVADLAQLGLLLVKETGTIQRRHRQMVNALMLTCGLYQASGRFAVRLGLPTKSGVSGALLSLVPGEGAIAIYSPALDASGNSVAGLFLLEQLAQALNLSLFG